MRSSTECGSRMSTEDSNARPALWLRVTRLRSTPTTAQPSRSRRSNSSRPSCPALPMMIASCMSIPERRFSYELRFYDVDCRQWKDHLSAASQELLLARDQVFSKMPGQDQKVVRIGRLGIGLGNDRNPGAGSDASELVGIDVGDAWNLGRAQPAILQDDVPFGRRAIAEHLHLTR